MYNRRIKINQKTIDLIVELYTSGKTTKEISEQIGIANTTVLRYVKLKELPLHKYNKKSTDGQLKIREDNK